MRHLYARPASQDGNIRVRYYVLPHQRLRLMERQSCTTTTQQHDHGSLKWKTQGLHPRPSYGYLPHMLGMHLRARPSSLFYFKYAASGHHHDTRASRKRHACRAPRFIRAPSNDHPPQPTDVTPRVSYTPLLRAPHTPHSPAVILAHLSPRSTVVAPLDASPVCSWATTRISSPRRPPALPAQACRASAAAAPKIQLRG